MKFILMLLLSSAACLAQGQTNTVPRITDNRYLFIIENAEASKQMANAIRQTVYSLAGSGLEGRLQQGDTMGIWSYNQELQVGQFPMQRWIPHYARKITENVFEHLRLLKFEKKPNYAKVAPRLRSVVQSSKRLIVIIVSSGKSPIEGTPFDADINSTYQHYAKEMQEAKIPFVTFLGVHEGKFINYSVNSSLGPFTVPRLPEEPKVVIAAPPPVAPPSAGVAATPPLTLSVPPKIEPAPQPEPVAEIKPTLAAVQTPVVEPLPAPNVPLTLPSPPEGRGESATVPVQPETVPIVEEAPPETTAGPALASSETPPSNTIALIAEQPLPPKSWTPYAAALFLVAGIAFFLIRRRPRSGSQPSLISRSMEEK